MLFRFKADVLGFDLVFRPASIGGRRACSDTSGMSKLALALLSGLITACSLDASLRDGSLLAVDDVEKFAAQGNIASYPIQGSCPQSAQSVRISIDGLPPVSVPCVNERFSTSLDLSALPEGQFEILFVAGAQSDQRKAVVDTIPPAGTIDGAVPVLVTQAEVANFVVSGTCTDGAESIQLLVGPVLALTDCRANNTYRKALDLRALGQGPQVLSVTLFDEAANALTLSHAFVIDTSAPEGTVLGGLPNDPSPRLLLDVAVSGPETEEYRYKVGPAATTDCSDPAGYSTPVASSQAIRDDISLLPDGLLRLCVLPIDEHGNVAALEDALVDEWTKDTMLALVQIGDFQPSGSPSNSTVGRMVTLSGDAIASYKAVIVRDGTCTVPAIDWDAVAETPISSVLPVPVGADGEYRVCALGRNTSGHWQNAGSPSSSPALIIDTTAPTVTLASSAPSHTSQATWTVTATFSEAVSDFEPSDLSPTNASVSDFARIGPHEYRFDVTGLADGSVEVAVAGAAFRDLADNANVAGASIAWTLDTGSAIPVLSAISSDPGHLSPVEIAVDFGEIVTGLDISSFEVTGGTAGVLTGVGANYQIQITPASDDETITVRLPPGAAFDLAANPTSASGTLTLVYDAVLPLCTMGSGPAGWITSTAADFGFTCTDNRGLAGAQCRLDHGAWGACDSASAHGLTSLTNGSHVFEARGVDTAGNASVAISRSFQVDVSLPTCSITSGPVVWSDSANVDFGFACADNESVAGVECEVDGAWGACSGGANHSLAGLADGSHAFAVRAIDPAGNVGAPVSRTFTVDTVPPVLTLTATPADPAHGVMTGTVGFSAGDLNGVTTECRVDAGPFESCSSPWTTPVLAAGAHVITVRATDPAGHSAEQAASWTIHTYAWTTGAFSGCTAGQPSWQASAWGACSAAQPAYMYGAWGSCSVSCGGGLRYRTQSCPVVGGTQTRGVSCPVTSGTESRLVQCQRDDGSIVDDGFCEAGAKPASTQACSRNDCAGAAPSTSQSCSRGGGSDCHSAQATNQQCNTQACQTWKLVSQSGDSSGGGSAGAMYSCTTVVGVDNPGGRTCGTLGQVCFSTGAMAPYRCE